MKKFLLCLSIILALLLALSMHFYFEYIKTRSLYSLTNEEIIDYLNKDAENVLNDELSSLDIIEEQYPEFAQSSWDLMFTDPLNPSIFSLWNVFQRMALPTFITIIWQDNPEVLLEYLSENASQREMLELDLLINRSITMRDSTRIMFRDKHKLLDVEKIRQVIDELLKSENEIVKIIGLRLFPFYNSRVDTLSLYQSMVDEEHPIMIFYILNHIWYSGDPQYAEVLNPIEGRSDLDYALVNEYGEHSLSKFIKQIREKLNKESVVICD